MSTDSPLFRDHTADLEDRLDDLLSRLTLDEKMAQLSFNAPAVERLGIPAYVWWNECLHGVARAGRATVFPQSIGLAATFNAPLVERVGAAISDEGRAKYHDAQAMGNHAQYLGLTYWTPNVNIFRDPRWGRGQETYGEDPYLTGQMGMALVRGLQGDDPRYLKAAACAKHYVVHSGPESERHTFDAQVTPKDLRETYLPAFRDLVVGAKVESVMGAYNRTNGELCCASPTFLGKILREEWGFDGHVVSDCGAIRDFHENHKYTKDWAESAARAVKNGCDVNCGLAYGFLKEAYERGLIDEGAVDVACRRAFRTRFRLGMFDPDDVVPYSRIPADVVDCEAHRELAREAARQSLTLLKNNGILPLRGDCHKLLVCGPNADSHRVLLANYNGYSSRMISVLEGVVGQARAGTVVDYAEGCGLVTPGDVEDVAGHWLFNQADVIVAVMGITNELEGEEGDGAMSDAGGDRVNIGLPEVQREFLEKVVALGKPVVLVLGCGSALTIPWAHEHCDAVLKMWYPGEEGGNAVADVLFGAANPAGRLPVTVVKSADQLPDFRDYEMTRGRTYRYLRDEPLYPFGFGLSYTRFEYGQLTLSADTVCADEGVRVTVEVRNVGERDGDEVVQLYVRALDAPCPAPLASLRRFVRVPVAAGDSETVTFELTPEDLATVLLDGTSAVVSGRYTITVGGCSPSPRGQALGAPTPAVAELVVT